MSAISENIEAIILDKDGVFVDFHKLWLRVIAYRAQLLAEYSSETSEMLSQIRANCIRAMGVDEDDETIDPYGPSSMPWEKVRLALATALFIVKNEHDPSYQWSEAFAIVDRTSQEIREQLPVVELTEEIPGSVDKIKELAAAGYKLGVYTSDSEENAQATLDKFVIDDLFSGKQTGETKDKENYISLCQELGVDPSKTLVITDNPNDIKAAKAAGASAIAVLSGVITEDSDAANEADQIINSLADLEVKKKLSV